MNFKEQCLYDLSVENVKIVNGIINENPKIEDALVVFKKSGYETHGPYKTGCNSAHTTVKKNNVVIYVANNENEFTELDIVNIYNKENVLIGCLLADEILENTVLK